jgi:hypothetical protein
MNIITEVKKRNSNRYSDNCKKDFVKEKQMSLEVQKSEAKYKNFGKA